MKNIFSKVLLTGLVLLISQLTVAQISETTEESNPFSGSSSSEQTAAGDEVVRITVEDCKNCDSTSTEIGILKDVNPEITFKFDMTNWDGTDGEYILYSKATGGSEQIINSIFVTLSNSTFIFLTYAETNFTGEVYAKFKNINGATSPKSNVFKIKVIGEDEEDGGSSNDIDTSSNGIKWIVRGEDSKSIVNNELGVTVYSKFSVSSINVPHYVEIVWNKQVGINPVETDNNTTRLEKVYETTISRSDDFSANTTNYGETKFAPVFSSITSPGDEFWVKLEIKVYSSATNSLLRSSFDISTHTVVNEQDYLSDEPDFLITEKPNVIEFNNAESIFPVNIKSANSNSELNVSKLDGITYKWQKKTETNPTWRDVKTGDFYQMSTNLFLFDVDIDLLPNGIPGLVNPDDNKDHFGYRWNTSDGAIPPSINYGSGYFGALTLEGDEEYRRVLIQNGESSYSNVLKIEGSKVVTANDLILINSIKFGSNNSFLGDYEFIDNGIVSLDGVVPFVVWQKNTGTTWQNIEGSYSSTLLGGTGLLDDYINFKPENGLTGTIKYRRVAYASFLVDGNLLQQTSYSNELTVTPKPMEDLFSIDYNRVTGVVSITTNFPESVNVEASYNKFMTSAEEKIVGYNGNVNSGTEEFSFTIPSSYFETSPMTFFNVWIELDGKRTLWSLETHSNL